MIGTAKGETARAFRYFEYADLLAFTVVNIDLITGDVNISGRIFDSRSTAALGKNAVCKCLVFIQFRPVCFAIVFAGDIECISRCKRGHI